MIRPNPMGLTPVVNPVLTSRFVSLRRPSAPVEFAPVGPFASEPPAGAPVPAPTSPTSAQPAVPASSSVASTPTPAPSSSSVSSGGTSSGSGTASAALNPQMVSGIVDPVTGITYSGYLTTDAQTLYNAGTLLVNGNQLTAQGSALAAQGDLITGTPAPTTVQVEQAQAAITAAETPAAATGTDFWTEFTTWASSETWFSGVPNGAVAAAGIIGLAMLFGKKKGRR